MKTTRKTGSAKSTGKHNSKPPPAAARASVKPPPPPARASVRPPAATARTSVRPAADTRSPTRPPPARNGHSSKAPFGPELDVYLVLLEEIWTEVHPLIGAVTLSALFKSAARRLAPAHSCVAALEVPIEGVDREIVRRSLKGATTAEAVAALRDLVRDLLTLFESIAGPVIVRLLLPKIVRAEAGQVQQGGA
jgi:hypothetical protein